MAAMRRSCRGSESGGAWAREIAQKRQKRRPGTPWRAREGPGESGNVLDAAFPGPPGPSQRVFWEFTCPGASWARKSPKTSKETPENAQKSPGTCLLQTFSDSTGLSRALREGFCEITCPWESPTRKSPIISKETPGSPGEPGRARGSPGTCLLQMFPDSPGPSRALPGSPRVFCGVNLHSSPAPTTAMDFFFWAGLAKSSVSCPAQKVSIPHDFSE
jgi:hypothetical protein